MRERGIPFPEVRVSEAGVNDEADGEAPAGWLNRWWISRAPVTDTSADSEDREEGDQKLGKGK